MRKSIYAFLKEATEDKLNNAKDGKSLKQSKVVGKNSVSVQQPDINVEFVIWDMNGNKVDKIPDNDKYQKIEYVYTDDKDNISIDFILGKTDGCWNLWAGKLGAVSYTDKPVYNLDASTFEEAINVAYDKIVEFIGLVKNDKNNYSNFITKK